MSYTASEPFVMKKSKSAKFGSLDLADTGDAGEFFGALSLIYLLVTNNLRKIYILPPLRQLLEAFFAYLFIGSELVDML